MPVYPGDPPVRVRLALSLAGGDGADVTELSMSAHAGTHVDAPGHMRPGGSGVDRVPIDALIGRATLVDIGEIGGVLQADSAQDLVPRGTRRLLLRCGASAGGGIDAGAAAQLVRAGVVLVGIDRPSIAEGAHVEPVHHLLLDAGVVIVEGLRLGGIAPGPCALICAPLLLVGADGAPARVFVGPPQLLPEEPNSE